jgi:hypothetical protein
MAEINLGELTKDQVTMLTGHPRGLAARDLYNLDALDEAQDIVVVRAPSNLDPVPPSFVQGLLAMSLRHLGEQRLREKYDFSALPSLLKEDFETGLSRLLLHKGQEG